MHFACLQLEFERCHVRRLEKEQRRMTEQLEEERAQHKQLSCALAKECKWASARALEEGHRLTELSRKLDKVASDPPRNLVFYWYFQDLKMQRGCFTVETVKCLS